MIGVLLSLLLRRQWSKIIQTEKFSLSGFLHKLQQLPVTRLSVRQLSSVEQSLIDERKHSMSRGSRISSEIATIQPSLIRKSHDKQFNNNTEHDYFPMRFSMLPRDPRMPSKRDARKPETAVKTLIRNSLQAKCHARKQRAILEHKDTRTQRKRTAINTFSFSLTWGVSHPQRYMGKSQTTAKWFKHYFFSLRRLPIVLRLHAHIGRKLK